MHCSFVILSLLIQKAFCTSIYDHLINSTNKNYQFNTRDNVKCERQKQVFKENFGRDWTLKLIDSTSKIPSGIFNGNVKDPGNFDECIAVYYENEEDIIQGKYCYVGMSIGFRTTTEMENAKKLRQKFFPSPFDTTLSSERNVYSDSNFVPIVGLSLCIPDGCSPSDMIPSSANALLKDLYILEEARQSSSLVIVASDESICQTKDFTGEINNYDIAVIVFLLVVVLLMVTSTTYDLLLNIYGKKPRNIILVAFSVYTNGNKILKINKSPAQLHCLNGLRTISIFWVALGHRYSLSAKGNYINILESYEFLHKVESQYVQAAPLAVDTFLFMAGLLLVYATFKPLTNIKCKLQGWNNSANVTKKCGIIVATSFMSYVHRYLRLTPAVATLWFITVTIWRFVASGPLWPLVNGQTNCKEYWWTFFLYIQNYVNVNDFCIIPTWYLSMDMQMFLASPLLLWPLVYYPTKMVYVLFLLIAASIALPFYTLYTNELQMFTDPYYEQYYYLTHQRLAPWLIGILLGTVVVKTKEAKFRINKILNLFIWATVLIGMGAIIVCQHDIVYNFEKVKSAIFISLHRAAWAIGLSWIVWSSIKGYGGIINSFLSCSVFQVLGKLTYSIYLVHCPIMTIQFALKSRQSSYLSQYGVLYEATGDIFFAILASVVWALAFESPMIVVEKAIFGHATKPKSDEQVLPSTTNRDAPPQFIPKNIIL